MKNFTNSNEIGPQLQENLLFRQFQGLPIAISRGRVL